MDEAGLPHSPYFRIRQALGLVAQKEVLRRE
jgi:hypothetical protein